MLHDSMLRGRAHALGDLVGQGAFVFEAATPIGLEMPKAEMVKRERRLCDYHIKVARF